MSLREAEDDSEREIHLPADIDWEMLDKSKFFLLETTLFFGVSATLYPVVVLKTRQQVGLSQISCFKTAFWILKSEGFRGLYRGFGTSLTSTIPARALYMAASVETATVKIGLPEPTASAIANAAGGLSAAMVAQLVWTPVDVISQRIMVQGNNNNTSKCKYFNGADALRKILVADGVRGLYRLQRVRDLDPDLHPF